MSYFTAKTTYPSRRTFTYKTRGDKQVIYFERRHSQFIIQTFPGLPRPEEGTAGLRLTFDEATAKALASALHDMFAQGAKAA